MLPNYSKLFIITTFYIIKRQVSSLSQVIFAASFSPITSLDGSFAHVYIATVYTAISIKVVPEQRGKAEYEREKLAGSDN